MAWPRLHAAPLLRLVVEVLLQLRYESPYVRLYQGDSRHLPLEDGTVSCVVTSPAYLGLRKYAGEQDLVWDEPAEVCEHVWGDGQYQRQRGALHGANAQAGRYMAGVSGVGVHQGQFCQRCGAWRGAFGLEPTPQLYIRHLMVFMDELWRVLRSDGVCFVNLGDSMAGSGGAHKEDHANPGISQSWKRDGVPQWDNEHYKAGGIRPKSLMLIPERFALACQERGWIVRSRIVWAKPNPMPESVRDRPTDAWEHIWMLTKSERYWWDQEAVRESQSENTHNRGYGDGGKKARTRASEGNHKDWMETTRQQWLPNGRNLRNVWAIATQGFGLEMCQACGRIYEAAQYNRLPSTKYERLNTETEEMEEEESKVCGRCKAVDAWLSHFAIFPSAIPERCILAACPPAICTVCGVPRKRIVEHTNMEWAKGPKRMADAAIGRTRMGGTQNKPASNSTLGWSDCGHNSYEPGLVLDPFSGAGTTCIVAQQLGRRAVGVDLSEAYTAMAIKRLEAVPLPMELPL